MEDKILESIAYTIPAIVTGAVAYFILSGFIDKLNEFIGVTSDPIW